MEDVLYNYAIIMFILNICHIGVSFKLTNMVTAQSKTIYSLEEQLDELERNYCTSLV